MEQTSNRWKIVKESKKVMHKLSPISLIDSQGNITTRPMWHKPDEKRFAIPIDNNTLYSVNDLASEEQYIQVAQKQTRTSIPLDFSIFIAKSLNGCFCWTANDYAWMQLYSRQNVDIDEFEMSHEITHINFRYGNKDYNGLNYTIQEKIFPIQKYSAMCGLILFDFGLVVSLLQENSRLAKIALIGSVFILAGIIYSRIKTAHAIAAMQKEEMDCDTAACYYGYNPQDILRLAKGGKQFNQILSLPSRILEDLQNIFIPYAHPCYYRRIANVQRIIDEQEAIIAARKTFNIK
jgi:hypothetical protein